MSFRVGQSVECINAKGQENWLVKGAIYVITSISADGHCLRFHEEPTGHFARRFRPLIENKSTISFTQGAPKDSERWDNRVRLPVGSSA